MEAHFSSEASFQKVRVAQLEEALQGTEKAVEVSVRRKAEVEGLLVAQQRASRAKEDQISGLRDDVGAAVASADRANIALEVSRAAESRLGARVLELEKEVASHVEMAQSLTRIEVGLSQHAQQESAMVNLERELLQRANEAARKELQDQSLISKQQVRSLEDDVRASRARANELAADVEAMTTALARAEGAAAASAQEASVVSKELEVQP